MDKLAYSFVGKILKSSFPLFKIAYANFLKMLERPLMDCHNKYKKEFANSMIQLANAMNYDVAVCDNYELYYGKHFLKNENV